MTRYFPMRVFQVPEPEIPELDRIGAVYPDPETDNMYIAIIDGYEFYVHETYAQLLIAAIEKRG